MNSKQSSMLYLYNKNLSLGVKL